MTYLNMTTTRAPSIFNDVIGPVMRGPSSSHSAAAVRIGRLVHDLCGGVPDRVALQYDSLGSLATTHTSQGTDMGLYSGLLSMTPDDPRLVDSPALLEAAGTEVTIDKPELGDAHPNTYRIQVERGVESHSVIALSTGGGMIEVTEIDGWPVSLLGDYAVTLFELDAETDVDLEKIRSTLSADTRWPMIDLVEQRERNDGRPLIIISSQELPPLDVVVPEGTTRVHQLRPVLPVLSRHDLTVPFHHAGELDETDALDTRPLSDWALRYEMARGGIDQAAVFAQARHILDIMRTGVDTGLQGTEYKDRILGWQSGNFVSRQAAGELLDGGLLNTMIPYVTALMEAKSAMEVIVAAPTAGACATFPGAVLAAIDAVDASGEQAERALLTGGLIGVFVTNRSSFAAEVGGCQAETGAGAAMAAAALVELAGGSAAQSLSAASQSLQNVLGLICDPVGNRVEAPCLGRNVTGAANALSCANMALAGYDHVIPFDEVLDAHRQVSELMARELRCTGLGGLAVTPTAQRIELSLKPGTR